MRQQPTPRDDGDASQVPQQRDRESARARAIARSAIEQRRLNALAYRLWGVPRNTGVERSLSAADRAMRKATRAG